MVQEGRVCVRDVLAAGVVDEDAGGGEFVEEREGLVHGEGGRGGGFEVRFPGREGEGGRAVGGAEAFGGAGDEDEGDVGELVAEGCELGEEVAAYAAGSWGRSDDVGGSVFAALEDKEDKERKMCKDSIAQFFKNPELQGLSN